MQVPTKRITSHRQLEVYRRAFAASMVLFHHTKRFPAEERYSLTDQGRRSSRSVASSIAEGWRKRRYEASCVNKLNDAEGEAAETQTWIEYAVKCGYLDREAGRELYREYEEILAMLVSMIVHSDRWTFEFTPKQTRANAS
jgi:four helix bundle protein